MRLLKLYHKERRFPRIQIVFPRAQTISIRMRICEKRTTRIRSLRSLKGVREFLGVVVGDCGLDFSVISVLHFLDSDTVEKWAFSLTVQHHYYACAVRR